jgi:large subunit ribosomal protein L21
MRPTCIQSFFVMRWSASSPFRGQSRSHKIRRIPPGAAKEKGNRMYAVIRTGGKQYCAAAGDTLEVEKLPGSIGDVITLSDVLLVSKGDTVTVGAPVVDGATVTAKITGQYRGNKIMVFKYRPKKRIRVRKGHRQYLTRLQIEAINA